MLSACGSVGIDDSEHEVYVHGRTEHTIRVESDFCDDIQDQTKKDDCLLNVSEGLADEETK